MWAMDDRPDAFTRESLLRSRGYPDEIVNGSNGKHPEPEPEAVQVCALEGCDQAVAPARGAKFCSEVHRRRASTRRQAERERTNGSLSGSAPRTDPVQHPQEIQTPTKTVGLSGPRAVGNPLEDWAALARSLPAGWSAELSPSRIVVTWNQ
jgi:hypothetical protein